MLYKLYQFRVGFKQAEKHWQVGVKGPLIYMYLLDPLWLEQRCQPVKAPCIFVLLNQWPQCRVTVWLKASSVWKSVVLWGSFYGWRWSCLGDVCGIVSYCFCSTAMCEVAFAKLYGYWVKQHEYRQELVWVLYVCLCWNLDWVWFCMTLRLTNVILSSYCSRPLHSSPGALSMFWDLNIWKGEKRSKDHKTEIKAEILWFFHHTFFKCPKHSLSGVWRT